MLYALSKYLRQIAVSLLTITRVLHFIQLTNKRLHMLSVTINSLCKVIN